jgi:acyl-CoA synthetase (AMP-forming)/AMP-acid ligase II
MSKTNDHSAPPDTWAALLHEAHRRYAGRVAVLPDPSNSESSLQSPMTYGQLYDAAARVAGTLATLAPRGARVMLALDNRPETVIIERALALWGYVRVAVSPRLHPRELAFIASDCRARVIVCEAQLALALRESADGLEIIPTEHVDGFGLTLAGLIDAPDDAGNEASHEARHEARSQPRNPAPSLPEIRPDDIASLMYTSGTTGRPKGAINTHLAWAAMARRLLMKLPPPRPGDVLLHAAPMSHFSGSVSSAFMVSGGAIATLRRFDPARTLERAREVNATCLPLVPTMLATLTREARERNPHEPLLPSLRVIPYGGSPIAPATLERARDVFGPVLVQFYGMSEALIPLTCLAIDEHGAGRDIEHRLATAGSAVPGGEVRLDAVRDGIGEICVRGAHVSAGYWLTEDSLRPALDTDGWLHTGDLASIDKNGRFRIVDRISDVVISGGFNVYPAEVERVIAGVRGVADVAVIGVPHEKWGEAVTALIVEEPGGHCSNEDILIACRAQIAGYKKPLSIERLDAFPKTSTGKTDKRALRERYWKDAPRKVGQ